MRFFLTGFMGCGKTFWGTQLASLFNLMHVDLDALIEQQEGMPIHELFMSKGETYFRQVEHACLTKKIHDENNFIMSTGGGTPCFHDHDKLLYHEGIVIYLKASTEFLFQRLKQDKSLRPLLQGLNDEEIRKFIEVALEKRAPYYNTAHHIVEADSLNEAIFAKILSSYA